MTIGGFVVLGIRKNLFDLIVAAYVFHLQKC